MKAIFPLLLLTGMFATSAAYAQTNYYPASGNVGINTGGSPQAPLHVLENGRSYFVNKPIGGQPQSEDTQGRNYILLHPAYVSAPLGDYHVMGKIVAARGSGGAWNRKFTVEVNTASSFQSNRGSIIAYNEPARLVFCTYNGVRYVAVEVENNSSMYSFSFTGYIGYHTLELRYDQEVSNVVAFEGLDPVSIQGQLSIGLAPAEPYGKLVVQESKAVDANDWSALIRSTNAIADRDVFLGVYNQNAVVAAHNYGRSLWKDLYVNTANGVGDGGNVFIGGPGKVGIGTTDVGSNKLTVEGTIGARKVKVTALSPWPDYVFAPAYELPSIAKVEQYIREHQHLPGIPAAAEVKERGVDLGEMNAKLLEKIEELTLYLIEQNKRIETLERQVNSKQR